MRKLTPKKAERKVLAIVKGKPGIKVPKVYAVERKLQQLIKGKKYKC